MGRLAKASLLLAAISTSALLLQACGANDDPFKVKIINDTGQTVVDHGYFEGQPEVLKPGRSVDEDEFANEGVGQDRITSATGRTLGCLPFQFSENPPVEVRVKLTEMVPCRNWGNPSGNSRYDWPNRSY